jgi:hypothetical protein
MDTERPTQDELDLEAFFGAARAETPAPRVELLNAVLADAAEVSAARAKPAEARGARGLAAGPFPGTGKGMSPGMASGIAGFLRGLGGWRAATALGLCAAAGFGAGITGWSGLAGDYVWGESTTYD